MFPTLNISFSQFFPHVRQCSFFYKIASVIKQLNLKIFEADLQISVAIWVHVKSGHFHKESIECQVCVKVLISQ